MALTEATVRAIKTSLHQAYRAYKDSLNDTTSADEGIPLLNAVIDAVSKEDIPLDNQSSALTELLFKNVSQKQEINAILDKIQRQLDYETEENKRKHAAQGHFSREPLHVRPPKDELQDHDIVKLMPQSAGTVEVLALINKDDTSAHLVPTQIRHALVDLNKKHVIIPVGPGHYRGVYITKPDSPEGQYTLEIFDPYGPEGASTIEHLAKAWLVHAGVAEEKINLIKTGPTHLQPDAYSCGDYTVAHSHEKMKAFVGELEEAYQQRLIDVLKESGNTEMKLRTALLDVSRTLSPTVAAAEEDDALKPIIDDIANTFYKKPKEGEAYHQYRKMLHDLFKGEATINQKTHQDIEHATPYEQDEKMAAKLQAEEFKSLKKEKKQASDEDTAPKPSV